jgi:hypothetical protein
LGLKVDVASLEDEIRQGLQAHKAREEADLNEIKLLSDQLRAAEANAGHALSESDSERDKATNIAVVIAAAEAAAAAVIAKGGTTEEAAQEAASTVMQAGGSAQAQAEAAAAAVEAAGGTPEECGAAAAVAARAGGSTAQEAQKAAAKAAATALSRHGASPEEVEAVAIAAALSAGASKRLAQEVGGEVRNDDWDKQKVLLTAGLRRYEEMIQDLQVAALHMPCMCATIDVSPVVCLQTERDSWRDVIRNAEEELRNLDADPAKPSLNSVRSAYMLMVLSWLVIWVVVCYKERRWLSVLN